MTARGRKANASTPQVDVQLNQEALASATKALDVLGKRSTEVAERFADGLSYDRERVVAEARFLMSQSAEAMLEAGKRLIQLKENEEHGDFTSIVTGRLGLGERAARNMMAAAVKYLSPALEAKRHTYAVLGKSKMFDLMVESEDDLASLAEGGTIAGHTLDAIDRMTARELKAALRKSRDEIDGKTRLIDKKNKKIDELSTFTPGAETIARNAEEQTQLEELARQLNGCDLCFRALANVVAAINQGDSVPVRLRAQQAVEYVVSSLAQTVYAHGFDIDLSGLNTEPPEWAFPLNNAGQPDPVK